jgi:chemotaxis signal transduction protein
VGTRAETELVVVVGVGEHRCALRGLDVVEVLPMVMTDHLPDAPRFVEGVFDLRGRTVPVVDLGLRFGEGPRSPRLDDRLVVVDTANRELALHVGQDIGLRWVRPDEVRPSIHPEGASAHGFVVSDDGLMVIYDVDALLTSEDAIRLDEALSGTADAARGR